MYLGSATTTVSGTTPNKSFKIALNLIVFNFLATPALNNLSILKELNDFDSFSKHFKELLLRDTRKKYSGEYIIDHIMNEFK